MLRKACDNCEKLMQLNEGWELEFRQGIRRVHLCSWECLKEYEWIGLGDPVKVHRAGVVERSTNLADWQELKNPQNAPVLVQAAIDKALLKSVEDADEDTDLKRIVDDARLDKTVYTDEIDNV